jgi:Ca2+-binding EF-hand superfamily protein
MPGARQWAATGGCVMTEQANHQRARSSDECKVSKGQLLRFIEAKFRAADRDQDGLLTVTELGNFLRFLSHPDLRSLQSQDRLS